MRKTLAFLSLALVIGALENCSSSKATAAKATEKPVIAGVPRPGPSELAAAQKRWPSVTAQTMDDGYDLFTGACAHCHAPKDIPSRSEEQWQHALDKMIPKAHLSDEDAEKVREFVLAAREVRADK